MLTLSLSLPLSLPLSDPRSNRFSFRDCRHAPSNEVTKGVALIFEIPYLCLWLFGVKKKKKKNATSIFFLPFLSTSRMEWKGRCSRRFLKVKAPVLRPLYYLLHAPFKRTWTIFKEELHKAVGRHFSRIAELRPRTKFRGW